MDASITSLDAVERLLRNWSADADRYRSAALDARTGVRPGAALVAGAEETQERLCTLLDTIDQAISTLSPGDPAFRGWLRTQVTASALLESVGNSLDVLERIVAIPNAEPTRIGRSSGRSSGLKIAAE